MRGFAWPLRAFWHGFEAFSMVMDRSWRSFTILMVLGMWGLLSLNAVARWAGGWGVGWSMEIVGYMIAWSMFLMMAPVAKENAHIRVTYFPIRILGEKRGEDFMRMAENLAGLGIMSYLSIQSYIWIGNTREMGLESPSMGGWFYPLWIIRLGILIGFSSLTLVYFESTVNLIRRFVTPKGEIDKLGSNEATPMEVKYGQTGADAKDESALGYRDK